jgi:hypothetical protein
MKLMLYYTAFYLYEVIHRPYILELYIIDIFILSFYHLSIYPHPFIFIFISNPQSYFFVMEQFQLLQLYD